MKTIKFLSLVGVISLICITSCDRNKKNEPVIETNNPKDHVDVRVTPEENAVITEAQMEQERAEFKHNAELRIEQNNKKIEELNQKIEIADAHMRKQYRQRIEDLKERNAKARKRLTNYSDKSKSKWEEFKREFNRDIDELERALKDFTIDNKK
ncbi:MAG: sll1863 family stress response protein [Bacteroidia bacterium]